MDFLFIPFTVDVGILFLLDFKGCDYSILDYYSQILQLEPKFN